MGKIIIKFNNDVVDHIDLRQGDMKIGRKPGDRKSTRLNSSH